jgi:hypothetical protein
MKIKKLSEVFEDIYHFDSHKVRKIPPEGAAVSASEKY